MKTTDHRALDENAEQAQQRHVERDRTEGKLEDHQIHGDGPERGRHSGGEKLLDRTNRQESARDLSHDAAGDEAGDQGPGMEHRPMMGRSARGHYERRSMT